MRLDFLEIEQFRGISGLRLNKLGDVNLLLGNNDAGKTSVLEAVKIFEVPDNINSIIYNSCLRTRGTGAYKRDNYRFLERLLSIFPFAQEVKRVSLGAGIDGEEHTLVISGETTHVLKFVYVEQFIYGTPPDKQPDLPMAEQEVLTFSGALCYNGKNTPFQIDEYYHDMTIVKNLVSIVYMGPVGHLSAKGSSSIYTTSKRQEDGIVSLLQMIDPEIEGFKLQPGLVPGSLNQTIEHKRFGNVPLYTYGDGMKKILSLASGILDASGGILLIDEIETSLQASHLTEVFRWLLRACRKFEVQLFVTTHSLEAISALASCAVEDRESELACYRLEADNGRTFGHRFSERDLDAMVNGRGFDVR